MVELLVVVAIIAVLAVMVLVISSRMVRRGQAVRCLGQMREVSTAPRSAVAPVIQSAGFLTRVLNRIMGE